MIRRSTLSDANKRRPSSFFGGIYRQLYEKYTPLLADSRTKREISTKLYVMDSTTKSGVVMVNEYIKGTYRCRRILRRTDDGKDTVDFVTYVQNQEDMTAEQICETYRRRWTIESLFKKQESNFPLKYFLGDNVNAIEIQIWITISSYVNIISLLNNPRAVWEELLRTRAAMEENHKEVQLELEFSP